MGGPKAQGWEGPGTRDQGWEGPHRTQGLRARDGRAQRPQGWEGPGPRNGRAQGPQGPGIGGPTGSPQSPGMGGPRDQGPGMVRPGDQGPAGMGKGPGPRDEARDGDPKTPSSTFSAAFFTVRTFLHFCKHGKNYMAFSLVDKAWVFLLEELLCKRNRTSFPSTLKAWDTCFVQKGIFD